MHFSTKRSLKFLENRGLSQRLNPFMMSTITAVFGNHNHHMNHIGTISTFTWARKNTVVKLQILIKTTIYFTFDSSAAQGCVDTHDYCGTWNGYNLCEDSYFGNMLKTFYCKKTCNAC